MCEDSKMVLQDIKQKLSNIEEWIEPYIFSTSAYGT